MSNFLFNWIQESHSWKTSIELNVLDRQKEEYEFLKRPDDFYITLYNKLYRSLVNGDYDSKQNQQELLFIAKGLEIYSAKATRAKFHGVDYAENILYAASIYYLTDYYTTATVLANLFETSDYESEIDQFIHAFLVMDRKVNNLYMNMLNNFLITGNQTILKDILHLINSEMKTTDPYKYAPLLLAENLLKKFSQNNIWTSLTRACPSIDWKRFITQKIDESWVYFPSQEIALEKGILTKDKTFSLQMPTSSGKTALCELIIYNEVIHKGRKVILLAPFRSLASELKIAFTQKFNSLGLKTKTMYGGHIPTKEEKINVENVDLLICTPEKFMAIENQMPNIHDLFSTVICDEGHLLDDQQRGLNYELLLSKFKNKKSHLPEKKFIYLSAIIPNIETINSWLGGDEETLVQSDYRPTELSFGYLKEVKKGGSITFSLDMHSDKIEYDNYEIKNVLSVEMDYKYKNSITKRPNTYNYKTFKARSASIALRSLNNGSVALFTPQKGNNGVRGLGEEIINQINLLQMPKPLNFSNYEKSIDLLIYFEKVFGKDYILTEAVKHGFVIHHGDLPQFVREIIEKSVREKVVPLVVCTNTLAEGVNLPIKTLVLHTIKRFNFERSITVPIKKRDIKNIVGRAGRAGKEKAGIIISVNPNEYKYIKEVILEDEIEPVKGHLYHIIKKITEVLIENRLLITNDIIEQQSEEFQRLIDSIDKTIIDSLYEEVSIENLNEIINIIINETYSYFQANDNEKKTLEHIFKIRSEVIAPYIQNNRIKALKESDSNVRIYEEILDKINISDDFWENASFPSSEEFIKYMINIILQLNYVKYNLKKFHEVNKIDLNNEILTLIINLWMEGKWFNDISIKVNIDVEKLLKIFIFINSTVSQIAMKITTIVKIEIEKSGRTLSEEINNWGLFLQYGFNDHIYLTLLDLGFTERISTYALGDWITRNFKSVKINDNRIIEMIIRNNKSEIIERLSSIVPNISLEILKSSLRSI